MAAASTIDPTAEAIVAIAKFSPTSAVVFDQPVDGRWRCAMLDVYGDIAMAGAGETVAAAALSLLNLLETST